MSRVDKVLRLYWQGWTPSRISRDLRMRRTEVDAILNDQFAFERLGVGDGSTADRILAALSRHEADFVFVQVEDSIELLLELADRLDAAKGLPGSTWRSVVFSLEAVLNGVISGFTPASSPLIGIQFRCASRLLGCTDETEWPDWLRVPA